MSVIVVGSFIVDCIARCNRAPEAGETVVGNSFKTYLGGKGANQAFASKRMGSETYLIGAVGKDNFGQAFIDTMIEDGFDPKTTRMVGNSTGTSLVTVEENGQNRIVMTPGANLDYQPEWLYEHEELFKACDYVVTQFEMRYEIVQELAKICKKYKKKFILNPAPAKDITDEVLDGLYLITPNETELGLIVHRRINDLDGYVEGAKLLLAKGVQNVIVTLGTVGSLLVNDKGHILVPAKKVKAIDTVGAGDSYTGSLVAMLDQSYDLEEAMKIATAVAALEVQKNGAIPAMPFKEDVFKYMKE
jgi:ribokinase